MHAGGPPERSGAPDRETGDQAEQHHVNDAEQAFAMIGQVDKAECQRSPDRRMERPLGSASRKNR